jgi:hypothetical protein
MKRISLVVSRLLWDCGSRGGWHAARVSCVGQGIGSLDAEVETSGADIFDGALRDGSDGGDCGDLGVLHCAVFVLLPIICVHHGVLQQWQHRSAQHTAA